MYSEINSNKRRSVVLMTLFIVIIITLGWIFDQLYGQGQSYAGIIFAILFSLIMTTISFFSGDKIALASTGAKPMDHDDNEYVYHLVENLCITAGLPMPKIYLIEDPAINAFATGRDPKNSSIALTSGAINKLEKSELEGVIAHELSHIKNYDIRFMMLVAVMVGAIILMADILLRSGGLLRVKGNDRNSSPIFMVLMIAGVILAILSPLIAELIKLAISRKREYLADASGALLTRYPEGLANALNKIASDNQPMKKASSATAHLFISSPFKGKKKKLSNLFATHPPIEDRVAKLKQMGI